MPLLFGLVLGCAGAGRAPDGGGSTPVAIGDAGAAAGRWAVDPHLPGPDLPPVGRSLFDHVTGAEVPFPLPALARRIAQAAFGRADESLVRGVLIPAGRSLQRDAAAGAPFDFPRALLAVDRQPEARGAGAPFRPLLDARLYVAYQEKAALLEVLSYNEAAGRFEFQVVRDYAPGKRPVVEYARRALCTSCHQNGAAIFSRPLWDETNANVAVAARLGARGARRIYGLPIQQGVDVAYQIDDATDRANVLSALQVIWREGCGAEAGARCRADLLRLVLAYRLSDAGRLPENAALPAADWRRWLPGGVQLPNPDIPNRDPFSRPDIAAPLEPLLPRAPLERWPLVAAEGAELARVVDGLGTMLADDDVRWLDDALAAGSPPRRCAGGPAEGADRGACFAARCTARAEREPAGDISVDLTCEPAADGARTGVGRLSFAGRLHLGPDGTSLRPRGEVDTLDLDGRRELRQLAVAGGQARRRGRGIEVSVELASRTLGTRARRLDGRTLGPLEIALSIEAGGAWPPRAGGAGTALGGRATLAVEAGDPVGARLVEPLVGAPAGTVARDALSDRPFRRARIVQALAAALGRPARAWCCADDESGGGAAPRSAPDPVESAADLPLTLLHHYCGECHDTEHRTPPNFLHGAPPAVAEQVSQCAERIAFRLAMWAQPAESRARTPMPPPAALDRAGVAPAGWPAHPDYARLGTRMRALAGPPRPLPYRALRPCLAAVE